MNQPNTNPQHQPSDRQNYSRSQNFPQTQNQQHQKEILSPQQARLKQSKYKRTDFESPYVQTQHVGKLISNESEQQKPQPKYNLHSRQQSTQEQKFYKRPAQSENFQTSNRNQKPQHQNFQTQQRQGFNQRTPLQSISQANQNFQRPYNQQQARENREIIQMKNRDRYAQQKYSNKDQQNLGMKGKAQNQPQTGQQISRQKQFEKFMKKSQSRSNTFLQNLQLFFIVLTFFYSFLIFYIYLIQIPKLDFNYHFQEMASSIKYIDKNLKTQPIKRLRVSTNSTCLSNEEKLVLGYWPGTVSGCNCGKLQKTCSRACKTLVNATAKQPVYKWKEHIFCIQRYEDWGFYNLQTQRGGCENSDFSVCDEKTICVKKNETEQCPIKKVQFWGSNQVLAPQDYVIEKWDSSLDFLIWYSNEFNSDSGEDQNPEISNAQLLANLVVSVNGLPCLSLDSQQRRTSKYLLLNSSHTGCGTYGQSTNSLKLDEISEKEFYDANVNKSLYNTLPGYTSTMQEVVWLSAETKIIPNLKECSKINVGGYENDILQISSQDRKVYYVTLFVFCMVLMIIIQLCLIFGCTSFENPNTTSRRMRNSVARNLIFITLLILGIVLLFSMVKGYVSFSDQLDKTKKIKQFANNINTQDCFSNYQVIKDMFQSLESDITQMNNHVESQYTFIQWLNGVYFFFYFISFIIILFSCNPLFTKYFTGDYGQRDAYIKAQKYRLQQRQNQQQTRYNQNTKQQISRSYVQDSNIRLRNDPQLQRNPEDQMDYQNQINLQ